MEQKELNGDLAGYIRAKIRDAVAGVDAKVAEVKQEESEIRNEVEKHSGALEAIKRKRRTLARKARKNAEAKVKLKKLDADQRSIELEAENLSFALEDCQRNLSELEVEREDAQRRACLEVRDGELIPLALKQAEAIDGAIDALVTALADHLPLLEWLQRLSHNAGQERAFVNVGLRQVLRVWNERLRSIAPDEVPSEKLVQYRNRTYLSVLASMAPGTGPEPNGHDTKIPAADPEAGAGAEASYIETRTDDPASPVPGRMWLRTDKAQ